MNKAFYEAKANSAISNIIEAEALEMGLQAFFEAHTFEYVTPGNYEDAYELAKAVTRNLPEWCSVSAFFVKFRGRFEEWYATGDYNARPVPAED